MSCAFLFFPIFEISTNPTSCIFFRWYRTSYNEYSVVVAISFAVKVWSNNNFKIVLLTSVIKTSPSTLSLSSSVAYIPILSAVGWLVLSGIISKCTIMYSSFYVKLLMKFYFHQTLYLIIPYQKQ